MKNFLIKLGASLILLLSVAQAAEGTLSVATTTNHWQRGEFTITRLILTSASACVVNLYDSGTNINTFNSPAYTITTTYATNYAVTNLNTLGFAQTNNVSGIYSLTQTVSSNAAAALPSLISVACGANGTTTIEGLNLKFSRGITAVATASGTMTFTYQPGQ